MLKIIKKPFEQFKWRWASFQPSENLNSPPVFFGVLRALAQNEDGKPNSDSMQASLQQVENDLRPLFEKMPKLARDRTRNLFRNSQQYWSSLGVLEKTTPTIKLTEFGHKVANGEITGEEFAAATVLSFTLPNKRIDAAEIVEQWGAAKIEIKPLSLILKIIIQLSRVSIAEAYLTNEELVRVVIPLSSQKIDFDEYPKYIQHFRKNPDFFENYDDFAPSANDRRMSREFLLFLWFHRFLSAVDVGEKNDRQKFFADSKAISVLESLLDISISSTVEEAAEVISVSGELGTTEREKRMVNITSRPGQRKFRREVLQRSGVQCSLTGENLPEVLRACHIIPVEMKGSDEVGNGICLREDLHIMFDSGHLRIDSAGNIHLSDAAKKSPSYIALPRNISLPKHIDKRCIDYRWRYMS
jgi:hypothetical protein